MDTKPAQTMTARNTEYLTQLAVDVLTNQVFMAQEEKAVKIAFMIPLMFAGEKGRQQIAEQKPMAFYEYIDKAGPRSVNRYPSFFSMQWLTSEEWEIFWPIYEAKRQALHGDASTETGVV